MPPSPSPAPETPAEEEDLVVLLTRVAAGDSVAFAQLWRTTGSRAFGFALRVVRGDREAASDAVTDAYSQIWKNAGRYRKERGSPLAWMLTMVRSRCLDLLRRRQREVGPMTRADLSDAVDLTADGVGPAQAAAESEVAVRVRTAAGKLPRGQREAIGAAFFGGLSHTEIARRLGVPLGTVKTRIRAGMMALRDELAAEGESS